MYNGRGVQKFFCEETDQEFQPTLGEVQQRLRDLY